MACRLVGDKPLSEPMLEYCPFDPEKQPSSEVMLRNAKHGINVDIIDEIVRLNHDTLIYMKVWVVTAGVVLLLKKLLRDWTMRVCF